MLDELLASRWHLDGRPPLFLMGHSLGGLLAIEAVRRLGARSGVRPAGLVLITPSFRPNGRPGRTVENLAVDAVWELRRLPLPFLPLSLVRPAAKALLELNLPFDTTWGKDYLSDLQPERELITVDPLVLRALPSAYTSSIESYMAECDLTDPRMLPETLLLLPEYDGIVDVRGGLRFARRAAAALGAGRLSLLRYPGLRAHDLFRSSVGEAAAGAVVDWIGRRLGGPRSENPAADGGPAGRSRADPAARTGPGCGAAGRP